MLLVLRIFLIIISFFNNRKRVLRSKPTWKEHTPCHLDNSSGSGNTDSDGI